MLAFASDEVDPTSGLRCTGIPRIDDIVIEGVLELGQILGDGAPVGAFVYCVGLVDVLEYEGVGSDAGDASEAYFCGGASAFVVMYALFFAESRL